jgi:hypothetical protein
LSRVKVTTHSGESYETIIESYDPIKLNSDLNDIQLNTVLIGDVILAKIDVKGVFKLVDTPLPEEPEEVTDEDIPVEEAPPEEDQVDEPEPIEDIPVEEEPAEEEVEQPTEENPNKYE